MGYVKLLKNKAYFKRFQVKRRRRRLGKTDYQARRRLVVQDKNKYNAPKYRFCVRITNSKVICQVMYSSLEGDHIMADATSMELKPYGITVGLTNYSAAYCTGLLCARRLLKSLKMDTLFESVEATGEDYHVEEANTNSDRQPFKALLDVGLVRTTRGNKVFAVMKGACDGGMHIPHSPKRFPGHCDGEGGGEEKEATFDPAALRARIVGGHVAEYMRFLEAEDPERYKLQFGDFIKAGVTADGIEPMYIKAHAQIKADPDRKVRPDRIHPPVKVRTGDMIKTSKGSYPRPKKLTCEQRKQRVANKIRAFAEAQAIA